MNGDLARAKLPELGPVGRKEWMMLGVFILLLVLNWEDVKAETGAWDTLEWGTAV